jgi:hypothetical protein
MDTMVEVRLGVLRLDVHKSNQVLNLMTDETAYHVF